jgi:hypothetical protein
VTPPAAEQADMMLCVGAGLGLILGLIGAASSFSAHERITALKEEIEDKEKLKKNWESNWSNEE